MSTENRVIDKLASSGETSKDNKGKGKLNSSEGETSRDNKGKGTLKSSEDEMAKGNEGILKLNVEDVMANDSIVKLMSRDGKMFEVHKSVANESQTLKIMMEDTGTDQTIRLPNVSSEILSLVIEYCKYHVESRAWKSSTDETQLAEKIKLWDADFLNKDQYTLFNLILAANYLHTEDLLDLTLQAVADKIKYYSVEKVRQLFQIENDFTKEEEAALLKENEWAFQ